MTQKQFRAALARLGVDQGEAAEILGCTIRTVNGYANGKEIPVVVERFLHLMINTKTSAQRYLTSEAAALQRARDLASTRR
jgi:hypothetical protein